MAPKKQKRNADIPPMLKGPDLYAELGLARNATLDDVKRAYRKLALQCHPDKCPGDNEAHERFQRISLAYSVLSDDQKRRYYDQTGTTEGLDISPDEFIDMFKSLLVEIIGGADMIRDMLSCFTPRELARLPPFPFPKELFPPGTFPAGLRFSSKGLKGMPIQVEELIQSGDLQSVLAAMSMAGPPPFGWDEGGSGSGGGRHARFRSAGAAAAAAGRSSSNKRRNHGGVFGNGPLGSEDDHDYSDSGGDGSDSSEWTDVSEGELQELCGAAGLGREVPESSGGQAGVSPHQTPQPAAPPTTPVLLTRQHGSGSAGSGSADADATSLHGRSAPRLPERPTSTFRPTPVQASPAGAATPVTGPGSALAAPLVRDWMLAARSCDVGVMAALLGQEPLLLGSRGPGLGHTALHWCAAKGCVEGVQWLLGQGLDVNVRNDDGATPLHAAARNGRLEAVEALLAWKEQAPNVRNATGTTTACAHVASASSGCPGTAAAAAASRASSDLAPAATAQLGSSAAGLLAQCDVQAVDGEGRTALQLAAEFGHSQIAAVLRRAAAAGTELPPPGADGASAGSPDGATATPAAFEGTGERAALCTAEQGSTQMAPHHVELEPELPGLGGSPAAAPEGHTAPAAPAPAPAGSLLSSSSGGSAGADAQGAPGYGEPKWGSEAEAAAGPCVEASGLHGSCAAGAGQAAESHAFDRSPPVGVESGEDCACGDNGSGAAETSGSAAQPETVSELEGSVDGGAPAGRHLSGVVAEASPPSPSRTAGEPLAAHTWQNVSDRYDGTLSAGGADGLLPGSREAPERTAAHQHLIGDERAPLSGEDAGVTAPRTTSPPPPPPPPPPPQAPSPPPPPPPPHPGRAQDGGPVEEGKSSGRSQPGPERLVGRRPGGLTPEEKAARRAALLAADEAAEREAERREAEKAAAAEAAALAAGLRNREEGKAWLESARRGDLAALKKMLAANPRLLGYQGQGTNFAFTSHTALHWAAAKGHAEAARWLLQQGADPDLPNAAGATPLHAAASQGADQCARLLVVEAAAKMGVADALGETVRDILLRRDTSAAGGDGARLAAELELLARVAAMRDAPGGDTEWTPRVMRGALVAAGVNVAGLLERRELVDACRQVIAKHPPRIQPLTTRAASSPVEAAREAAARTRPPVTAAPGTDTVPGSADAAVGPATATASTTSSTDLNTGQGRKPEAGTAATTATESAGHPASAERAADKPATGAAASGAAAGAAGGEAADADTSTAGAAAAASDSARQRGNEAFSRGDYPKAVSHYTMALRLSVVPSAVLYSNRSAAYCGMAYFGKAQADAEEAIRLEPYQPKYRCRQGAALLGQRQWREAEAAFRAALAIDPKYAAAVQGLADVRAALASSGRSDD